MLQKGDAVPDFDVTAADGARVRYGNFWQRKNLLLVALPAPASADSAGYVARLRDRISELTAHSTELVITGDAVLGMDRPSVIAADRWGEIHFSTTAESAAALPSPAELIEWLRFIQSHCPECEGESR